MSSPASSSHDYQRLRVCAVCWHASNHRTSPRLTCDGPDKDGLCKACKQPWKDVLVVQSPAAKKWVEIRPRPRDMNWTYKMCEFIAKKKECPRGQLCTYAHTKEELDIWMQERESSGTPVSSSGAAASGSGSVSSGSSSSTGTRIRKPDSVRSHLCEAHVANRCTNPECPNPHQFTACEKRFNGQGSCEREGECPYAHSDKELSAWNNWLVRTPPGLRSQSAQKTETGIAIDKTHWCENCQIAYASGKQLQDHFKSESHAATMKKRAQEKLAPKLREAPRNVFGEYKMCRFIASGRRCDFGENACTYAHSQEELDAWKTSRLASRGKDDEDGYADEGHRKENGDEEDLEATALEPGEITHGVVDSLTSGTLLLSDVLRKSAEISITETRNAPLVVQKDAIEPVMWRFKITTTSANHTLESLALLDPCMTQFCIKAIHCNDASASVLAPSWEAALNYKLSGPQAWVEVEVEAKPTVYGCYAQTLVAKFSTKVVGVQVTAHVSPSSDRSKLAEHTAALKKATKAMSKRSSLDDSSRGVDMFDLKIFKVDPPESHDHQHALPPAISDRIRGEALTSNQPIGLGGELPTCANIKELRERLHNLLFLEEATRAKRLGEVNLTDMTAQLVESMPLAGGTVTTPPGDLIFVLNPPTSTVLVSQYLSEGDIVLLKTRRGEKTAVVRGSLCHVSPSRIAVRVSKESNALLSSPLKFDVSFQLNRKRLAMLHSAIEAVAEHALFPQPLAIPPLSKSQMSLTDNSLNLEQVTAVHAILAKGKSASTSASASSSSSSSKSKGSSGGAIVISGPSGSGKTRALFEVIRLLSKVSEARVLVCAATDGTADSFVQNALQGPSDPKAIRIYETDSVRVGVVPPGIKSNRSADGSTFDPVTADSIAPYRVVVTTYASCGILARARVPVGHFTHIICDESGRVLMAEVLAALQFASDQTRIVLSGDTLQLTENLCAPLNPSESPDASFLRFLTSQNPWSAGDTGLLTFTKNYRINVDVLRVSSSLFYKDKLTCLTHPDPPGPSAEPDAFPASKYPLAFIHVPGEESVVSDMVFNDYEVMETAKQVKQLIDHWPSNWAPLKPAHVGVITATPLQAVKVRVLLKAYNLGNVAVYSAHEARSYNFRVVVYSAVWDRRSLTLRHHAESQEALFATVLSRASSIVIVIGNAQAIQVHDLKTKVWSKLLEICMQNNTFHGCDPSNFSYQVDTVKELAPISANSGEVKDDSPPSQSPTPSSVLSLASSVGGSFSPLGPTIGRTSASASASGEYSLPQMGSSNPWGVDDSSSIGSDLDLARSWSSTGVLAFEPERPRSLGVPASPLIGSSSVFSDSSLFQDERAKAYGRNASDFVSKNATAHGVIGSPVPGKHTPALSAHLPSIESARQALATELASADPQAHQSIISAHLTPLVSQLASPDIAQDIVGLLTGPLPNATEVVRLMASPSAFQDTVRQRADEIRGLRMLSRQDVSGASSSSNNSSGYQMVLPSFLDAQARSLLEHASLCEQQLNSMSLSALQRRTLTAQRELIKKQWQLLREQIDLVSSAGVGGKEQSPSSMPQLGGGAFLGGAGSNSSGALEQLGSSFGAMSPSRYGLGNGSASASSSGNMGTIDSHSLASLPFAPPLASSFGQSLGLDLGMSAFGSSMGSLEGDGFGGNGPFGGSSGSMFPPPSPSRGFVAHQHQQHHGGNTAPLPIQHQRHQSDLPSARSWSIGSDGSGGAFSFSQMSGGFHSRGPTPISPMPANGQDSFFGNGFDHQQAPLGFSPANASPRRGHGYP